MRVFDFEKTPEGRWYVVLPEWPGGKEALEMVMGADMMLEIYAQGSDKVSLSISETEVPGYDRIDLIEICDADTGGAYYKIGKINNIDYDFRIWLCAVTEFVFGKIPVSIYLKDCTF